MVAFCRQHGGVLCKHASRATAESIVIDLPRLHTNFNYTVNFTVALVGLRQQ